MRARFARAEYFAAEGRPADAVMELRAAEGLLAPGDPRVVDAKERAGFIFLAEHELDAAHEAFLAAISSAHELGLQNPAAADAYAGVGLCLAVKGDRRAGPYLMRGLNLGPDPAVRRRAEKALARVMADAGEDDEGVAPGADILVRRIVFKGNWTEPSVLLRRIPFREGDVIGRRELAKARAELLRMNQFKKVEISTKDYDAGAEVDITLKDGWYLLPFPVLAFGAGGERGGGLLEGRNLFNHAEALNLAVVRGPAARRVAVAGEAEGWSGRVVSDKRAYTERLYADGAYSSVSGLGKPADEKDTARFPAVAGSYKKTVGEFLMAAEGPIAGRWSGEAGFQRSAVGYSEPQPAVPPDSGKQGSVFLGVKYGRRAFAPAGLGAILGFGLADLDERLKSLRRPRWTNTGEFRFLQGGRASASGRFYGEGLASWRTEYAWDGHQALALAVAGGHGAGLPDAKLIATGRATALQGQYAREYRGPTALGASLSYDRRLYASRLGLWQAGVFLEQGRAWFHGRSGDKQGAGVTMFYRFWRFPLPFGVSYTWCFDDRQGQVAGAIGGRF